MFFLMYLIIRKFMNFFYYLYWDYEIILKKKFILFKINFLKRQLLKKFDILKEYIINNLGLKFIKSSQTEYNLLIFFIKKSSERFQLYIDY